jgi:FeS assembly SUF system regulator
VLRIGKLTDYATVLMTALAAEPARVHAAADLAQRGHLEPATASKILKMLAKAGLLASFRGATGGYRLARAPDEISLADIVAAMEGPFGMTECVSHAGQCGHEPHCGVRREWRRVSDVVESALRGVTLAQMLPRARRAIPVHVVAAEA